MVLEKGEEHVWCVSLVSLHYIMHACFSTSIYARYRDCFKNDEKNNTHVQVHVGIQGVIISLVQIDT